MEEQSTTGATGTAPQVSTQDAANVPEPNRTDEASKPKEEKPKKSGIFRSVTGPVKVVITLVVIVAIAVAGFSIYGMITSSGTTIVSKASLTKAVSISKLSTAEFTYNGIAEKYRDVESEDVEYYVYYEARATAGIDMEKIDFQIDETNRTVTPVLPEVTVGEPVVDESKLDYLPEGVDVNMREVLALCKEDAQQEMESNHQIRETAYDNLKATIEALLMPMIKGNGYTISWADTSATAAKEAGNNEAA